MSFTKISEVRQVWIWISTVSLFTELASWQEQVWGIGNPCPHLPACRAPFRPSWEQLGETEGKATECYLFLCQGVGVREM